MLALNHALVGAAIGSQFSSLPTVIVLGLFSHFVLDALPHVDQGIKIKGKEVFTRRFGYISATVELVIVALILYSIFDFRPNLNWINIVVGAFSAILIDLVYNAPFWGKWMQKRPVLKEIYWFHEVIQEFFVKFQFSLGIPIQIFLIIGSLWLLLK